MPTNPFAKAPASLVRRPAYWEEQFARLQVLSRDIRLKTYYAEGMLSGVTPLSEAPLVAVDFETTGLDPDTDAIVSIGLIPFTWERIYCRDAEHWVVKPEKPLREESVLVHGITHTDISVAPDLSGILESLLTRLAGRIPVVHCRQIEREFLDRALKARIDEGLNFPVIDTMELERRALAERRGWIGRLMRQPIGSLRLSDCRERYNLPQYEAHHALSDALATAELLQAQIAYHYRPDFPVGRLWC